MPPSELPAPSLQPQPDARFNFVADTFRAWAARQPDAPALLWIGDDGRERHHSYAQMRDAGARAASVLLKAGVRRGDTILIILGREEPWWEIMLGCLQLGIVASPGTTQLSSKDIAYRIAASGATAVVSNPACAEKVEAAAAGATSLKALLLTGDDRPGWISYERAHRDAHLAQDVADTRAEEDALCFFTSGTTGHPKMTIHAQRYPLGHLATGRDWLKLKPGALCWNLSDTGWAKAAWSSLFAPWMCGAAIMAHHVSGFDANATLQMLERFPVDTLCAPPTAYRMFVLEDLAALRPARLARCTAAGEPLNPETLAAWRAGIGLEILDGYGQTETALLCANTGDRALRPGSMGLPVDGIELAIIDGDGRPLAAGEEGDIAVRAGSARPPGLFKEYRGDPDRTSSVFRGDWYLTGDRACADEDGYFWFVGRADDVILSSGYRIGPFEVESALLTHPGVAESGVVASPDAMRGEVVKAFVVLAPGYQPSEALILELQSHVKQVTAPYKYPRRIEFVDALPKTVSGKILRKDLRAREWALA